MPDAAALQHLDDLGYFLAVAEAGSIAGGARSLGQDAATVSRHVARLEETVGCTLLLRTSRGVQLSESGERLAARGQAAVNLIALGIDEAVRPDGELQGPVRITAPTELGTVFVLPLLRPVRRAHPKVEVQLLLGAVYLDLERAEADIALRTRRPDRGDVVTQRLGGRPLLAYHQASLPAEEAALRWLAFVGTDPVVDPLVRGHDQARVVFRSNDLAGLRAACMEGVGTAVLPDLLGDGLGLQRLRGWQAVPGPPLWLAAPRTSLERPRVRVVWEALRDGFRDGTPPVP